MKKLKLFIENIFVYGFGGIISKLIPLILLPIITKIMPGTFYYGLSDLSNTLVQFATAMAVMGLYDAMFRLFFEKDDVVYKKTICSTALLFTIITSLLMFGIMCIFNRQISQLFFSDKQYYLLVFLSATAVLIGGTNTIISAPTRMQNKKGIYLITNTASSLIAYGLAIPLLLNGYYLIALPLAAIVSALTLEIIFAILNHKWFSFKLFSFAELKKLLILGVPLLPNLLIYWVFNSCDKVMITNIVGVDAAGIYSVASKLGHVSQLVYIAFAGGWQFFAFSTMKEEKQIESNSKVFEYLGAISFVLTFFICSFSFLVFKVFFKEDYLSGFISAPYLFLAPLLQMLFQIICNQFLVVKKTWPEFLILTSGAVLNIVLNLVLIPIIGIEGASIATLSGYVLSLAICMIVLIKMKLFVLTKRNLFSIFLMIVFFVLWRFFLVNSFIISLIVSLMFATVIVLIYLKELKYLFKSLFSFFKKRKEQ